jgi:peptide deformylase
MKLITNERKSNGLPNPDYNRFLLNSVSNTPVDKTEEEELNKLLSEAIQKYIGYGISANQLGIDKRVCLIVNSLEEKEYLFLVNPIIIERSKEYFVFLESCLSIPKTIRKPISTYRHERVKVKTDNLGELIFEINPEKDKEMQKNNSISLETLQTVIVQHEIDHLDGITIQDRNIYNINQNKAESFGRNDKILMKSPSGEFVEVKYKKANEYFVKGYEII